MPSLTSANNTDAKWCERCVNHLVYEWSKQDLCFICEWEASTARNISAYSIPLSAYLGSDLGYTVFAFMESWWEEYSSDSHHGFRSK